MHRVIIVFHELSIAAAAAAAAAAVWIVVKIAQ